MSRIQLYLITLLFFAATCLWAQGRIGGGARGGGTRGGGGGLGSAPGSIGGSGVRGGFGSQAAGTQSATRSVHPRGYIGRSSSLGQRAREAAAAQPADQAASANSSRTVAPGGIGRASTRARSAVILDPRSNSIPPLGPSIPPLERPGVGPGRMSVGGHQPHQGTKIFRFNRRHGGFFHGGGLLHSVPIVVVPYAYGSYSYGYDDPNIILVDPHAQTTSGTEYVVSVDPQAAGKREPAPDPKVVELQPEERDEAAESGEPEVEVLQGGGRVELEEKRTIYLVALKSGVIHTSLEHWLEGETLHYVTFKGAHETTPLTQVDLDFTRQLNAERNLPFVLEVRPQSQPESTEEAPRQQ